MYRNEYEKIKLNKPSEIKLLIIPSTEKMLKLEVDTTELISETKVEKQMFLEKIISPKFLIAKLKREFKLRICSQIKYEEFINIPNIIILKINGIQL